MNLPIYQIINMRSSQIEDIMAVLHVDMNLRRPVALVCKTLDRDQQREVIGLVENWFSEGKSSWRFPYPVYIVADHGEAMGQVSVVPDVSALPKFFNQKEIQTNVKESQIIDRSRLLQQEIRNTDPIMADEAFKKYGLQHKKIWFLVQEAAFYETILTKLNKKKVK